MTRETLLYACAVGAVLWACGWILFGPVVTDIFAYALAVACAYGIACDLWRSITRR